MPELHKKNHTAASLRIVFIYATVGALWIFFSDSLLNLLVHDPDTMSKIAIAKGWLYVAVTTILLFLLIKKAMTAMTSVEEKQAKTEVRYRTLFENSGDALMIHVPPDWHLTDANLAAMQLFGYPDMKSFLETHPADLSPGKQTDGVDSRVKSEAMLHSALDTGSRIFQWKNMRRDGTQFDSIVRLTKIDFDGTPSILAAVRDISEFIRIDEERKEIERRLMHTQKLESLGVLVSGIAHDFNNLLAAASGTLELALLSDGMTEDARQNVKLSASALQRASQLTRQMLDYTRKGRQARNRIYVNTLINENAELMRAVVPKRISVDLKLGDGIGNIVGDSGQIHQVIMNLLTNATEAIGGNNGNITITTYERDFSSGELARNVLRIRPKTGKYAVIEVSDTGSGMDSETLARIFEPYYTTKLSGRGLGMAVVMSIVENHKGGIFIDSVHGRGTKMTLLLPVEEVAATEVSGFEATTESAQSETRKAVLLAEDDEETRKVFRTMLTLLGYETIEASDGKEALEKWRKNASRISAALVDLNMPGVDGAEFLRSIRLDGGRLPVILTSGNEQIPDDAKTKSCCFLQKPFSMGELGMAISLALAEAE